MSVYGNIGYQPIDPQLVAGLADSYIGGVKDRQQQDLTGVTIEEKKAEIERKKAAQAIVQRLMTDPQAQTNAMTAAPRDTTAPLGTTGGGGGLLSQLQPEATPETATAPPALGLSQRMRNTANALMPLDYKEAIGLHKEARAMDTEDMNQVENRQKRKIAMVEPIIKNMIENGDNEGLAKMVAKFKADPDFKDYPLSVDDIKITPKKDLEITIVKDIGENEVKDPTTGKFLPAGTYKIKTKSAKDGSNPILVGAEPYTEKADQWQSWGKGQMRNKDTGEIVKVPAGSDLDDVIKSLTVQQKQQELKDKSEKVKENALKGRSDAEDYTRKMLNDDKNFSRLGGEVPTGEDYKQNRKLKPEALISINERRSRAGLPPIAENERKFQDRNRFTGTVTPSPKDSLFTYSPAPDTGTSPVPSGGGLSGQMPVQPTAPVQPASPVPQGQPMGGLSGMAQKNAAAPARAQSGGGLAGMASAQKSPVAQSTGKVMTQDLAKEYLRKFGGDKDKARKAARQDGYSF